MKIVGGSNDVKPSSIEERDARRRGMIFGSWVTDSLQLGAKISDLAYSLARICEVKLDLELGSRVATFRLDNAVVTIRVVFADEQSGAQMVITNMTTLPDEAKGKGFGSKALQSLLEWAHLESLETIQAVQVQRQSESFWIKNGFVALCNITNDYSYIRKL